MDSDETSDALLSRMEATHGPMLSTRALTQLLSFGSQEACLKAIRTGALEVPAFRLPGRPGYFVLTTDFVAWLLSNKGARPTPQERVPPRHAASDCD